MEIHEWITIENIKKILIPSRVQLQKYNLARLEAVLCMSSAEALACINPDLLLCLRLYFGPKNMRPESTK